MLLTSRRSEGMNTLLLRHHKEKKIRGGEEKKNAKSNYKINTLFKHKKNIIIK